MFLAPGEGDKMKREAPKEDRERTGPALGMLRG